jgi:hypothetical protein
MRSESLGLIILLLIAGCTPPPATPPQAADHSARQPVEVALAEDAADSSDSLVSKGDSPANPLFDHLLDPEQVADGWISLFDGTTLFGWVSNNPGINWKVENGAITADSGPIGLLVTTVPWADYELVCEYRLAPKGNSGIFLRTPPEPKDPGKDCYEVNIADGHPDGFLTGSLVGRKTADKQIIGSGDWQTLHVTARGNRLTIAHNGTKILDYEDSSSEPLLRGRIGLQKNAGKVEFRKVNLKPLGLKPLFNGKDLSGWREVPGSKSQFTVEEGSIHVTNGQGFLETETVYGDFVMQAQARTNSKDLNSGFFFRAMPGTEKAPSNGYELQIHNGVVEGNRDKPANAGTGAIFRRVEARRVVSDDLKWFTSTLVASGSRIAVWIDGFQVVDWEDQRAPDENPRKGQRIQAGHISLQGHDPTTDVDFRKLSIMELPPAAGAAK